VHRAESPLAALRFFFCHRRATASAQCTRGIVRRFPCLREKEASFDLRSASSALQHQTSAPSLPPGNVSDRRSSIWVGLTRVAVSLSSAGAAAFSRCAACLSAVFRTACGTCTAPFPWCSKRAELCALLLRCHRWCRAAVPRASGALYRTRTDTVIQARISRIQVLIGRKRASMPHR